MEINTQAALLHALIVWASGMSNNISQGFVQRIPRPHPDKCKHTSRFKETQQKPMQYGIPNGIPMDAENKKAK
ncbi:hypothetical protein [Comamonas thiooxydans]|uniref:hypothetical protein n=1 Tax=Comamonas thiooxydans TaxID=363952 RepID=UPI00209C2F08|nr:hypothetical protein [Comamonas thiooxydans]MCO8251828.1 hypothetical protein [Comamonas thiooxydans]